LTTGVPALAASRPAAVLTLKVLKVSLPLPATITVRSGTRVGDVMCPARTGSKSITSCHREASNGTDK
jgi:hypothetical protein